MRSLAALTLVVALGAMQLAPAATASARPLEQAAADLMSRMSPEERIGQLVLVTLRGSSLGAANPILDLLANHHISGVVLLASNDNFVDTPNTLTQASALISELQRANHQASLPPTPEVGGATQTPERVYVPLLIGISQEGNGPPFSQIRTGLSQLPSAMAIGATWDAGLARSAGELLGRELEALGINLVLGPSLDVLQDPRQIAQGDLGVRTFGGDPFWAGVMGGAFIEGLHAGSGGRLGVVAKHFPGLGGSDRPIEEEVSTVRKSLVQLQQIELAPFIAVTGAAPGTRAGIVDGLLTGQIRYQGFQGNIRDTTRPIGFDPDAFSQLMAVEPFASWRQGGGITVSGALGSRAVRRFYESLGQGYRGQLVARDAFLAGNDLLYLSSNFRSDGDPDTESTVRSTLDFFAQKYRDDQVFAERVDQAVERILEFKLRLYGGTFSIERVIPPEERMEGVGLGAQLNLDAARRAATLLSPSVEEIPALLGGPPRIGERVVFISDVRVDQQCSTCEDTQTIGRTAMEDTVKRLYGTRAAGQVGAWNLTSLSMADLAVFLGESPPSAPRYSILAPEQVDELLRPADWLVFLIQKSDTTAFGSDALKLLLDQRPELARDKKVVVFALDVPYDLDATEISKIDVYYALYGKTSPFIEVAARLLFEEISATGASPVSVPGIGYDLLRVTSPNPDQLISVSILGREAEAEPRGYVVGDVVEASTGVLLDLNSHPVPDGTPVEFILSYQGDPLTFSIERTTVAGVAVAPVTLERLGVLTIRVESEPARASEILQLNIQEGVVTVIAPTAQPSATPEPTLTLPPETETPSAAEDLPPGSAEGEAAAGAAHLGLGIIGVGLVASAGYFVSGPQLGNARVRRLLLILVGGLALYDYVAINLPGSGALLREWGAWGGLALGIAGGLLGWGASWLWVWLAEGADGGHQE
jgi:beta-N-acetylhexosaminidase